MPKIISFNEPEIEFRTRPVKGTSLYVSENVITFIVDHAEAGYSEKKEVMGLLKGEVLKDDEGLYVKATAVATSDLDADEISVRFKRDAMEELFRSIDECGGNLIVGWYHSHLGIGCYLSDIDIRVHKGIFGDDAGFALVIDPSDSTLVPFSCIGDQPQRVQMIILG